MVGEDDRCDPGETPYGGHGQPGHGVLEEEPPTEEGTCDFTGIGKSSFTDE